MNTPSTHPLAGSNANDADAVCSHRLRQPPALWQKRCRSLTGALFVAILLNLVCLWMASAEDNPGSAAVPFTGEVRYHFREKLPGATAGEKSMSAPATETEKLPAFRLETIDGKPVYRVAGRVEHLPLDFDIQLVHVANPDSATLKVNVTDPASQKPLVGFPQTIPNATAKLKEGIDLEIALSPEQKAKIEQSALGEGAVLTYANLVLTLASPPSEDAVSPSPSP